MLARKEEKEEKDTCCVWFKLIGLKGSLFDDLVEMRAEEEVAEELVPNIFWAKCSNLIWKPRLGLASGFFLRMCAKASLVFLQEINTEHPNSRLQRSY